MALNTRSVNVAETDPASFGSATGFVFTINCVVGAGFLGLPWAYREGGWLLCSALQVTTTLLGWVLSLMLLEVMSRVEAITRLREEGYNIPSLGVRQMCGKKVYDNDIYLIPNTHKPEITHRRFDVTEIVRILFGKKISALYIFILSCYTTGALVAYSSIFATSFASNIPLGPESTCDMYEDSAFLGDCRWKYLVYIGFFSVCMLYFTIAGLKEQLWMQVFMTGMRFFVMSLVIFICLMCAMAHVNLSNGDYNDAEIPAAVSFSRAGLALPIITFASIYQTQLPSIVEQMRNKDKTVPKVVLSTTVTSLFFYLLLGLVVPIAVAEVPSESTMAFRYFTAGYGTEERPWWAAAIGFLIIIFPALDVFSSFPLCSVALSDNLMSLFYGSVPKNSVPRLGYYGLKLLACVPALFLAILEFDLGNVLDWSGLFGFFLVPFMIPLCHIAGRKVLPVESQYDVHHLPLWANWTISLFLVPVAVLIVIRAMA